MAAGLSPAAHALAGKMRTFFEVQENELQGSQMRHSQSVLLLIAGIYAATFSGITRADTTTDEMVTALEKYERKLSNLELRIKPWPGRKTCWTNSDVSKAVIQTMENNANLLCEWHVEFDPPVSVMGKTGDKLPLSIAVDQRGIAVGEFGFFLGVCYLDQRRFTTLIRQPGAVLSTELDMKAGPRIAKLVASVPKHGVYEFWFDRQQDLQLSRFRFTKRVGDEIYDASNRITVGEADPEHDPLGGNIGPYTNTTMLVGDFGPIEYNDVGCQKSVTFKCLRQKKGGELLVDHEVKYALEIVGPCEVPLPLGKTQFIHPQLKPLETATNVVLFKPTGLRYDMDGGRLVQVVDQDALDMLNETRFRPPPGFRSPYFFTIMSLGIVFIISWLFIRSRA